MQGNMNALLLPFLIFTAAAFAQAVTGFGFVLVAVPLLATYTEPRTAVVAAALVSLALTGVTTAAERDHVRWPPTRRLILTALAGMPAGLLILNLLPAVDLTTLIAAVALSCTVLVWRRWRIPGTSGPVSAVGVVSGVLATATGTNGPPLVAALQAMGYPPRQLRATLAAILSGSGLMALVGFALTGALTAGSVAVAAVGLPAAALGGWVGHRVFIHLDSRRFRSIVLAALAASSAIALVHAAAGI